MEIGDLNRRIVHFSKENIPHRETFRETALPTPSKINEGKMRGNTVNLVFYGR